MRIVHLGVDLETNTTNGVNRVMSLVARTQRELGHDVSLVRIGGRPCDRLDEDSGLRIVTLPRGTLGLGVSAETLAALGANALGADIFHFHSVFMPEHNFAARHAGAPYVVSPHGAYHPRALQRSRWRKLAYRHLLDCRYLEGAAFVHALTDDEARAIRAYGRPRRVEVIPNPVEPVGPISASEREEARHSLGIADGAFVPVYVGRLDPEQKGLDLLIAAVREVAAHHRVRLLLAGPPAGASLESLVQPGDPITVLPPVFSEEKRRLLAAADAFASPSRWEGQPAAVLEALANGLPVIVSSAAGLTDFVEQNNAGNVVETSVESIAGAIVKLGKTEVTEPARERLALATRQAFGPEPIARRFISAYESVLSEDS